MAENPRLVPLREFGELAGIGRTKAYQLLGKGLPCVKNGRRILVNPEKGMAWLEGRPADEINLKFDEAELADIKKAADLMGWPLEEFIKTAVAAAIQQLNEVEAA